jgi:pyrimidine operon attenuation protein / uracil phosphoribosyltransferase
MGNKLGQCLHTSFDILFSFLALFGKSFHMLLPPHSRPLMGKDEMAACIERMAASICAGAQGAQQLALVGVHRRGVPLSQRLAVALKGMACNTQIVMGTIDITQYRDDLKSMRVLPRLEGSDIDFDMENAHVVLCDEVIYTGRTTRAALDELLDFGRPHCVRLAVLIDRGARELPIQPDYVGMTISDIPAEDRICVRFVEDDGTDSVYVQSPEPAL